MHKTHYITIFKNAKKYFVFLIIPVVRGLISAANDGSFLSWLDGAWIDFLILTSIAFFAFLRWFFFEYSYSSDKMSHDKINSNGIYIKKGFLNIKEIFIPFENISTLAIEQLFLYKPFKAVRVLIDTDGGTPESNDISMVLYKKEADFLKTHVQKIIEGKPKKTSLIKSYRSKSKYIFLLSAILSNTFLGVIFFAVLINQIGGIVGNELQSQVVGTLKGFSRMLYFGLSPSAAFIAYCILAGFFIGTFINIISIQNFTVRRYPKSLFISRGIFTNREFLISIDKINYITVRQGVITKILRIYSAFIQTAGYSSTKNNLDVIIPAISKKDFTSTTKMLLEELDITTIQLKPKKSAIFRYLRLPFLFFVFSSLAYFISVFYFKSWVRWGELIGFLYIMALALSFWFFLLRFIGFFSSGLAKIGNTIMICYSSGLRINKIYLVKNRIVSIKTKQNIFQKKSKTCDVYLSSYGERRKDHLVKSLLLSEVNEFIAKLDVNSLWI